MREGFAEDPRCLWRAIDSRMGGVDAPVEADHRRQYEVIGILGEGGTGVVYDAIRPTDNRAVALKVMHATLAGNDHGSARLRRGRRASP